MGIGTLGERSLHAGLKLLLEPDITRHEQPVDGYVADILRADGSIIEIQTGSFSKVKTKLERLLRDREVTLVYPATRKKWLVWIDPDTGEATGRRKSPKVGTPYEVFMELRWIRPLLLHENLHLLVQMTDVEEHRILRSGGASHRYGSVRAERLPLEYCERYFIASPDDYCKLIPTSLGETFTVSDYAGAAPIYRSHAQQALYVLSYVGAVREAGKQGRMKLYSRTQTSGFAKLHKNSC